MRHPIARLSRATLPGETTLDVEDIRHGPFLTWDIIGIINRYAGGQDLEYPSLDRVVVTGVEGDLLVVSPTKMAHTVGAEVAVFSRAVVFQPSDPWGET